MNWFGWLRRDRRYRFERVVGPCASMAECSRLLVVVPSLHGGGCRRRFLGGYRCYRSAEG